MDRTEQVGMKNMLDAAKKHKAIADLIDYKNNDLPFHATVTNFPVLHPSRSPHTTLGDFLLKSVMRMKR
jgi:hypothetical protein